MPKVVLGIPVLLAMVACWSCSGLGPLGNGRRPVGEGQPAEIRGQVAQPTGR